MSRPTPLLAVYILVAAFAGSVATSSYDGECELSTGAVSHYNVIIFLGSIVRKEDDGSYSDWPDKFMPVERGYTLEATCRCNLDAPMWKVWSTDGTELIVPVGEQYCIGCIVYKAYLNNVVAGRYLQIDLTHPVNETVILQCVYAEHVEDTVEKSDKIFVSVPHSTSKLRNRQQ